MRKCYNLILLKTIFFVGVLFFTFVTMASAEYLAYSVNKKHGEKPLPENVDNLPAKDMLVVKWSPFSGKKYRVSVLKITNSSNASVTTTTKDGVLSTEVKSTSRTIPIDGIEAILTDTLHRSGRFRVMERMVLDAQLKEQDFGASGRVSKPSAAKIGKVIGVEYQIQAVITHYEPNFKGTNIKAGALLARRGGAFLGGLSLGKKKSMVGMNFRLIDAVTSEVVFTKQVESIISKSSLGFGGIGLMGGIAGGFLDSYSKTPIGKAVIANINKGVFELVKEVGSVSAKGSIIMVKAGKFYINLGSGTVEVGDKFDVYTLGEELIDPDTGISLGSEEERLCSIKIASVKKKFSIAESVDCGSSSVSKGNKVISLAQVTRLEFGDGWGRKKSVKAKNTSSKSSHSDDGL